MELLTWTPARVVSSTRGTAESMWFVMNYAERRKDQAMIRRATDIVKALLEFGTDREYGGIYYFMDVLGKPHLELQWDMKLWWPHNEATHGDAVCLSADRRQVLLGAFQGDRSVVVVTLQGSRVSRVVCISEPPRGTDAYAERRKMENDVPPSALSLYRRQSEKLMEAE